MAKAQSSIELVVMLLILSGAVLFFTHFIAPDALVLTLVFEAVAVVALVLVAVLVMFFGPRG